MTEKNKEKALNELKKLGQILRTSSSIEEAEELLKNSAYWRKYLTFCPKCRTQMDFRFGPKPTCKVSWYCPICDKKGIIIVDKPYARIENCTVTSTFVGEKET